MVVGTTPIIAIQWLCGQAFNNLSGIHQKAEDLRRVKSTGLIAGPEHCEAHNQNDTCVFTQATVQGQAKKQNTHPVSVVRQITEQSQTF